MSAVAGISRYGTAEEIAELMAFVISPAARWMTGSTLCMDGGEVKSSSLPTRPPKKKNPAEACASTGFSRISSYC
ncbi:SDR family oxidoreductase [Paraburkholderia sp. EG304]|uniref:SDR family oxidoreductase n=1 Tax=Paraburkholderia sp. EG304 TaxID=3237015 RepID=UPI00397A2E9F